MLTWLRLAQLIVGVHRMFYCDSSDYSSNDSGDQYLAARQRAALEEVFNQYKACAPTSSVCSYGLFPFMRGPTRCMRCIKAFISRKF